MFSCPKMFDNDSQNHRGGEYTSELGSKSETSSSQYQQEIDTALDYPYEFVDIDGELDAEHRGPVDPKENALVEQQVSTMGLVEADAGELMVPLHNLI